MSIITDALKKAEHKRELKMKQASEEMGTVALAEEIKPTEVLLAQSQIVETEIEKSAPPIEMEETHSQPVGWLSLDQFRKRLILGRGVFLSLTALFLLWFVMSKNVSVAWHPFEYIRSFRMTPLGVYHQSVVKVESPPLRFEDKNGNQFLFDLSGISILGKDRYAIINGKILQEGDSINGAFLKQVLDQEVILETRSGEIKLRLSS